jgi:hypothetical protein
MSPPNSAIPVRESHLIYPTSIIKYRGDPDRWKLPEPYYKYRMSDSESALLLAKGDRASRIENSSSYDPNLHQALSGFGRHFLVLGTANCGPWL